MTEAGVDCAYFLVSGTKMLKFEQKKLFDDYSDSKLLGLGIDVKSLSKVGLDINKLLRLI